MTPSARLAAAIEILDIYLDAPTARLEPILGGWSRQNRYAGSKDRAAIAARVYDCVRRRRSYAALFGETGRGLTLASLAEEGLALVDVKALFSGEKYAPNPLRAEEEAGFSADIPATKPIDWPDWLWPALQRSVADPEAEAKAIARRASAELRVNTLKASIEQAQADLAADGVSTQLTPVSPLGLRLATPRKIRGLQAFRNGLGEPQDAASQAGALLGAAAVRDRAAPRVIDYCAGGGGKTLALAAALQGRGDLLAYDVAPQRMADIPERARRAGARIQIAGERDDLRGEENRCDLVLVDAPCSGSGAWARHADEKWRLTQSRLNALRQAQRDALREAAGYVCAGGLLLYATCSVLACENHDQADWFLGEKTKFRPEPLAQHWAAAGIKASAPDGNTARFTPARHGVDGFFLALFRCIG
ncbi:MAG: RsmB/NOP family class I SAM-dependent RNA methyltransferase [Neomegalonema sp.]